MKIREGIAQPGDKIVLTQCIHENLMKFNSQLNMSWREPTICDTPVSHSIDIPTDELKSIAIIDTFASSHNTR